jgi:hypothetical protein
MPKDKRFKEELTGLLVLPNNRLVAINIFDEKDTVCLTLHHIPTARDSLEASSRKLVAEKIVELGSKGHQFFNDVVKLLAKAEPSQMYEALERLVKSRVVYLANKWAVFDYASKAMIRNGLYQ